MYAFWLKSQNDFHNLNRGNQMPHLALFISGSAEDGQELGTMERKAKSKIKATFAK
jgi:hypothetical protein